MKVVAAPDSFKESMTAAEAARAMARGVARALPGAECVEIPMADGGEGTAEVLAAALAARWVEAPVPGPLGQPVRARYALAGDGLAVMDAASAIGLALVPASQRDPLAASSRGLGALIRHALDQGARRCVIGLGGSATSDGGAGMLAELGAVTLDAAGAPLEAVPAALGRLDRVDLAGLDPRLAGADIQVARDVANPLLGPNGAARVFGPQKGASPAAIAVIEVGLERWAGLLGKSRHGAPDLASQPGAGAAGGLGFALLWLGARLIRGARLVAEAVQLPSHMAGADLVLTGEGSLDAQTMSGKAPLGVAEAAKRLGVPVIAFAGRLSADPAALARAGFAAAFPIIPGPMDLAAALAAGAQNLERAVESALRVLALGQGQATGR
ncbi:MAG: glycerate kinase [Bifidobacteriaceae bacterium]|jgi:glycerate kinase|nr:glycerate kinase [Bifidobacteriaceae bacterium]